LLNCKNVHVACAYSSVFLTGRSFQIRKMMMTKHLRLKSTKPAPTPSDIEAIAVHI
jgi:hypothetical protein